MRCLEQRLRWRGLDAEMIPLPVGERIDFTDLDIVCWGGCSDREAALAAKYLPGIRRDFRAYIEDGGSVLAVCAAYQLLGRYYETGSGKTEGLGILDFHTSWKPERLVGNVVIKSELVPMPVVGFENHGGRTFTGSYPPFGTVISGHGNTEKGDYEGLLYKNVIATYLHGPLLPKNPQICDLILERALQRRYGTDVPLKSLPDEAERRANHQIVDRFRP